MAKKASKFGSQRKRSATSKPGSVCKKQQLAQKKNGPGTGQSAALRQRGLFDLLDSEKFATVPSCPHGPCLLFGERSGRNRRWFACAVYRSSEGCSFRVDVRADGSLPNIPPAPPLTFDYRYGELAKQFEDLSHGGRPVFYCQTCEECVLAKGHPKAHVLNGPLEDVAHPSRILPSMSEDNGEAQYWFSDDSVNVIINALEENEVDGVICIGAPSVFEHLKGSRIRRFMLDFDHRFARFYTEAEYAHYSLLVNHFYEEDAVERLNGFFLKLKKVAIVCDPPFGVFMKALSTSFQKLRMGFAKSAALHSIVAVPIFVGKHLEREGFSMVDYKVTYTNHKQFSSPERTIVRFFTDFPASSFNLSPLEGYKFCDICQRYVCEENKHCTKCGRCPSKTGKTFLHCDQCGRCVKPTYTHCGRCSKCHLKGRCWHDGEEQE